MQNLRTSGNKGSNDAYDVHASLTGYEPNDMVFSELGNSQGSFSYITQSSDLDIDDVRVHGGVSKIFSRVCSKENASFSSGLGASTLQ